MDLIQKVYDILSPLKIPVLWQVRPESFPGISYHFFNEKGDLFGDGETQTISGTVQIDIWSKSGHQEIIKKVRKLMKENKFLEPFLYDDYEDSVKLYRTVMTFNYYFKIEDMYD